MNTLSYLYTDNIHDHIKSLVNRHIDFNVSYSLSGVILTVDDAHKTILEEFCLDVRLPLKQQEGFQVFADNICFHNAKEFILDTSYVCALLRKAKKEQPNRVWYIVKKPFNTKNGDVIVANPTDNQFRLHTFSGGYEVISPVGVSMDNAIFSNKEDAYTEMVNKHYSGDAKYIIPIEVLFDCAQTLWAVFEGIPIDQEELIECDFLHFKAGTYRYDVWHFFESYFDLAVNADLAV